MSKQASSTEKQRRANEIKTLISSFCNEYLNEELQSYACKLCDALGRKRKLDITRGQRENWAAAIIYTIARLNFLFDPHHEKYTTPDSISDFFDVKKSTISNKATQIAKACGLGIGAEGYCSDEIVDMFKFYQTEEGFILPKSVIDKEISIEFVDGEEAEEIERRAEEQRQSREEAARKTRQEKAQKERARRHKNQLDLLDDL